MMSKLHLPNVTLFTTVGPNQILTSRSYSKCLDLATFGDAIFFTEHKDTCTIQHPGHTMVSMIRMQPVGSAQNSGIHAFRTLPQHLKTSHILWIDWDSGIVNPESWCDDFLQYDYIGARWPWLPKGKNIGNSGFSLISRKMLEVIGAMDLDPKGVLDADIGQRWRPRLEQEHGIKFPDENIADRFSYERHMPNVPSFGFHGFFNMWRHTDDREMAEIIDYLNSSSVQRMEYAELMMIYLSQRKFPIFFAMYHRLRKVNSQTEIMARLQALFSAPIDGLITDMLNMAEEPFKKEAA